MADSQQIMTAMIQIMHKSENHKNSTPKILAHTLSQGWCVPIFY